MKVDVLKLPYKIADFLGATASALSLGTMYMGAHVSNICSSNPYRFYYDFAFLVLSLLSYLTIFFFVWKFLNQFLSGRLNWFFILALGLYTVSTIWGILDSFQCSTPFIASLGKNYMGAIRTFYFFGSIMFFPFLLAFVIELLIILFRKYRGDQLELK